MDQEWLLLGDKASMTMVTNLEKRVNKKYDTQLPEDGRKNIP